MILMRRQTIKLENKEDYVKQWQTQIGNIITNIKVKLDFTLPEFRSTEIVKW